MTEYNVSAENKVAQVIATLAIENMYVGKKFKEELLLVAQNKKSSKAVLEELDRVYATR